MAIENPTAHKSKKPVLTNVDVTTWHRLKVVAAQNDRSLQGLVGEAVNGLLAKYERRAPATE